MSGCGAGGPIPRLRCRGARWISGACRFTRPAAGLRLLAEMRVPGRAWLEFRAEAEGRSTVLRQIAYFEPRGLGGLLYWYILWPIHEVMFRGMLRRIAAAALQAAARGTAAVPNQTVSTNGNSR